MSQCTLKYKTYFINKQDLIFFPLHCKYSEIFKNANLWDRAEIRIQVVVIKRFDGYSEVVSNSFLI